MRASLRSGTTAGLRGIHRINSLVRIQSVWVPRTRFHCHAARMTGHGQILGYCRRSRQTRECLRALGDPRTFYDVYRADAREYQLLWHRFFEEHLDTIRPGDRPVISRAEVVAWSKRQAELATSAE